MGDDARRDETASRATGQEFGAENIGNRILAATRHLVEKVSAAAETRTTADNPKALHSTGQYDLDKDRLEGWARL